MRGNIRRAANDGPRAENITNHPGVVYAETARYALPEALVGMSVHADDYDVMSNGEVLTPYAITALRLDGTRLHLTTIIDKGDPPGRFLALAVTAPPAAASAEHEGTADAGVGET